MEKEAKFMARVKLYIQEHGVNHFFDTVPPKTKNVLNGSIELPKAKADIEEFKHDLNKSLLKYKKLYDRFKNIPNVEFLIHRYDVIGLLNNISLSVNSSLKKEWGITHELFGSFYNSDYPHCSMFPDLEESLGNALSFKPKKDMILLVNPPYTVEWVKWTCEKLIEWKGKARFICIVPIWDKKSRKELGLKTFPDLPEINKLINESEYHEMKHIKFYDGINNKSVLLKDKVHIIII